MNISDLVPWRNRTPARRREDEPMYNMRQEMDRLFEDFFRDFELMPGDRERRGQFMPSVNVSESDTAIEATFELPGLSEDDIDVTLLHDRLTVTGEKREEEKEEKKNYYRRERSYGYFRRSIPLPAGVVDPDNVDATFDKGILTITMPKREEAQKTSKRITVKPAD